MNQVKELFRTRIDEDTYREVKAVRQSVYPLRDKKLTFSRDSKILQVRRSRPVVGLHA